MVPSVFLLVFCLNTALSMPNSVLFVDRGKTAMQTAFGHLVIPVNVTRIYEAFDTVSDVESALSHILRTNSMDKSLDRYSLTHLKARVDTVWSLVNRNTADLAAFENDDLNHFNDTLFGLRRAAATPTKAVPDSRRKRSLPAIAISKLLPPLAAFGLSLFSYQQLQQIRKHSSSDSSQVIAQRLEETDLRYKNLTDHLNSLHDKTIRGFKMLSNWTRARAASSVRHQAQSMFTLFRVELTEFVQGLITLTDHRLSPNLVEARRLQASLWIPPRQCPASGSTTSLGRRWNFIPMYHLNHSGTRPTVIRYCSCPALRRRIDDSLRVRPRSLFSRWFGSSVSHPGGAVYCTWMPPGPWLRNFPIPGSLRAAEYGGIWHCPRENVLHKHLGRLCLFNIFQQDAAAIERTCRVLVDSVTDHATQVSGSQFRVLAAKPVPLTFDCGFHSKTKVITIEGVYLLNLTAECPQANTPTHLFLRNAHVSEFRDLMAMPFTIPTNTWLGELRDELGSDVLGDVLQDLQSSQFQPVTLPQFRRHVTRERRWNPFLLVVKYVQLALSAVTLLYLLYRMARFGASLLSSRLRTRPGARSLQLRFYPRRSQNRSNPATTTEMIPLASAPTARPIITPNTYRRANK